MWGAVLPRSLQLTNSAMEPLPVPVDSPNNDMLRDLSNFVGGECNADIPYSSIMNVRDNVSTLQFSLELKRRDDSAVEGGANPNSEWRYHGFTVQFSSALQAIRTLVACPSWTHGQFVFHFEPGLDDLVLEIFALLRLSRSLSILELELVPFYHRHLPTLLWENPFLETLTLSLGKSPQPMDAEAIALCFSRNSVLESCILRVNGNNLSSQQWEMVLRPFTTSLTSVAANVALRELVLQMNDYSPCEDALANLVRCNTTLEKLEVRLFGSEFHSGSLAKALTFNQTLKEFGCVCSVADLKVVDVFISGIDGHPTNTHLTILKLYPMWGLYCGEDYKKELCRMLEFNTTLKHVEVFPLCWSSRWTNMRGHSCRRAYSRHEVLCTQRELELIMHNALRLNTSLQSLVLPFWKLLRVGGEWQMSYGGHCLSMKSRTAEYNVKVKMRH